MARKLMLGCDPELKIPGEDASKFVTQAGAFGTDGYPLQFEMRPAPAESAIGVVANLKTTLDRVVDELPEIKDLPLLAGHWKDNRPLGGHIHLSGVDGFGRQIVDALNAPLRKLSDLVDDLAERDRREKAGWGARDGRKGTWRFIKPRSNGENWIEFRVPGSWMLSPHIAHIHLWLAENIARSVMRDGAIKMTGLRKTDPYKGLIHFAESLPVGNDVKLFVKAAESVFKSCPLDWGRPVWEEWLT